VTSSSFTYFKQHTRINSHYDQKEKYQKMEGSKQETHGDLTNGNAHNDHNEENEANSIMVGSAEAWPLWS
jgi:hypothetical protein